MNTILVVDDEIGIREVVSDILEIHGYNILKAENGLEAINALNTQIPDLVICDINMPILDGYQVLKELKSIPETYNIPFLFLTAKSQIIDTRIGMNLGADDYLIKPFQANHLLEAVATQLHKKQEILKLNDKKNEDFRRNVIKSLPHEFRTPLNGIIGFANLIENCIQDLSKEEILQMVNQISTSGFRLLKLVQNYSTYIALLDKVKAGKYVDVELKAVSFSKVLKISLSKMKIPEGRENNIKINMQSDFDYYINIDDFVSLLTNVIDNAIKFSEIGELVEISAEMIDNNRVRVTILDEGRGFSQESMNNISALVQFERNTFEQQGAGLGLAIVMMICKLYNIKISFEGEKEVYAKVILEFDI